MWLFVIAGKELTGHLFKRNKNNNNYYHYFISTALVHVKHAQIRKLQWYSVSVYGCNKTIKYNVILNLSLQLIIKSCDNQSMYVIKPSFKQYSDYSCNKTIICTIRWHSSLLSIHHMTLSLQLLQNHQSSEIQCVAATKPSNNHLYSL